MRVGVPRAAHERDRRESSGQSPWRGDDLVGADARSAPSSRSRPGSGRRSAPASASRSLPLQARITQLGARQPSGAVAAGSCAREVRRGRRPAGRARSARGRAPRAASARRRPRRARGGRRRGCRSSPAPATQIRCHAPPASSLNSRPPVMPGRAQDQRRVAISAPTTTSRVPGRQVERAPEDRRSPFSACGEERVERADGERSDDRAPEARRAADDEHRERDERQVEIHRLGVQRQQVARRARRRSPRARPRRRSATSRCR